MFSVRTIVLSVSAGLMYLGLSLGSAHAQDEPDAAAAPTTQRADPRAQIEDVPGLPRVLLIGDSISLGYTLDVRELLTDKANVHRPPANSASTRIG